MIHPKEFEAFMAKLNELDEHQRIRLAQWIIELPIRDHDGYWSNIKTELDAGQIAEDELSRHISEEHGT